MGLNLGLLLFIVCLSGTVATVSNEIDWLFNPAIRGKAAAPDKISWDCWLDAVRREHPRAYVLSLTAPPDDGWAASAMIAYGPNDLRHVYLDPRSGTVQGTFSHFNVARFFRSFHKQFYIYPGELPHGIYVVGPLAIILLLSTITGLWFYRIRWRVLLLRPWPTTPRSLWSALHRASGMWTLGFAVTFGLTGGWYLVERVAADAGYYDAEVMPASGSATADSEGELISKLSLDQSRFTRT